MAQRFDAVHAGEYDAHWGRISRTHRRCLGQLLGTLSANAAILDAACGTGRYWPVLLDAGCEILGVDQSTAMLDRAHEKFPDVATQQCALQELPFEAAFDAVLCVDALEMIPGEEWPAVLGNLGRALRPAGRAYLTIELMSRADVDAAYGHGREAGAPLVRGEDVRSGGYHFHPELAAAHSWIREAGLRIEEDVRGDGYAHVIAQRRTG